MIESLVEQIEARHAEVQAQMSDPEVIGDRQRYADAGRQFNQLAPAAKLAEEWRRATSDAEGAQEMLDEGMEDPELREEMRAARERIEQLAVAIAALDAVLAVEDPRAAADEDLVGIEVVA